LRARRVTPRRKRAANSAVSIGAIVVVTTSSIVRTAN
jgi:hypothetical protein